MELKQYIQKFKLYLFDMDGTLYLGDRLYDFTIELLDTIRETGGIYLFMTNNSSKSVNDYVKKLKKLGVEATRDDFMTSSQATAYYLHKHHEGKKLYVCGTESLKEPAVIGKPSPLMPQLAMDKLGIAKDEACVVGDRIYTDIKSALNAGIAGILVLSGETTVEVLNESPDKPNLVLQDAGEILSALKARE